MMKKGIFAFTAASVFAMTPAFAQQGNAAPTADDQILQQEQAAQQGESLSVSPAVVRQIEQALNDAGYSAGNIDGTWDKQAETAMANWQQAQGVEPTGNINLRSLQMLGIDVSSQQASAGGGAGGGATGQ